ncbi:ABC-type multidrug transport system ATPase subunit [Enterococcus sp. PF1-24]|uniref:ATP-binding cassette domain-containing protein n=1 Tax=unclassified Enterococcus TaxID=2608891 RepID=UPI0024756A92|nr:MULTISPECIES: ATP-binding cassette domain-containing protein [unclassified Enterococcus]MDH6363601.1 ABC-type multidrug transport system ATPase subunit [Enterococcus sp. PFB1-1]MDH6400836.1 ABC-type multidrug transport system ATPase subunit [Enterococcus sp. PF1-24]
MTTIIEISGIKQIRQTQLPCELKISLAAGEGLAIFGPNGIGKSTLLDILAGILPDKTAQITINGTLGYAMQKDGFYSNLSCKDNLILEANYAQIPKAEIATVVAECAELFGVTPFLNKKVAKLSAGMRGKLALAAVFICQPQILLMDESFNALDEQTVIDIKKVLKKKKQDGLALLFVSHNREEFEGLCEKMLTFPELEEFSL